MYEFDMSWTHQRLTS